MTTYAYMRGSKIGYAELANNMAAYIGDADIDVEEFCDAVIEEVNRRLPASFAWYPHVSEVYADITETEELTEEELIGMISDVADELGENWDTGIPLNMRQTMDIERVQREEAEKVAEGTEYDWTDLTDWQSCHDLLYHLQHQTRADEAECRRQFHDYFVGCLEEMRRVDEEEVNG